VQRHFRRTTGLSPGMFQRIERARHATNLLRTGMPILEVVHEAGYFDQAHLTRSLRGLIGQTPAGVQRGALSCRFCTKQTPDLAATLLSIGARVVRASRLWER